ncbi:MAG TPA: hypothetical protein VNA14_05435 [Mycobacteriales bacterium]|nr:hypothetical protein [Mycobacteriales bacterium]
MYEYQWVETEIGDDSTLSALGREDWEAVSTTPIGEHFGKHFVRILMKRTAAPRGIDVAAYEVALAAPRAIV